MTNHTTPLPESDAELEQLVRKHFNDDLLLICGRVWEAWQYGTMTQDDFSRIDEDENVLPELIEKLAAHLKREVLKAQEATAKLYDREIKMLRAFQESLTRREELKVNRILEVPGPGGAKYIEFSTAEDAEKAMQLVKALTALDQPTTNEQNPSHIRTRGPLHR